MHKLKNKQVNRLTISFTKSDEDLMEFIEKLKKENEASKFIRDAIREKMNRNEEEENNNERIIKELEALTKKIGSMSGNYVETSESDSFLVSKEDRFLVEKENRFESVEPEEDKGKDLDGALDFFDF